MSTAGGEGFLRGVFEGCLSTGDMGISHRPYHKNCKCALHKSRDNHSRHSQSCYNNVSYPIRRTWSEGCLALMAQQQQPLTPDHSPPISPAKILRTQTRLVLSKEVADDDDQLSISKF